MPKSNHSELLELPIDQYSRQKWAANIIDIFRGPNQSFKILDVGGYKGKTVEFQSSDEVTVCDLFDVIEDHYVKGDGRSLPFKDKSFDFVLTFDTYEHVPRTDRENFIKELYRVSRGAVILAAPFDDTSGAVADAEKNLNAYYIDLYQKEHPWLQEHIAYKIPKKAELESLCKKLALSACKLPSNDLNAWVTIQTIYFSIEIDEDLRGRVDDINRFYNKNLEALDVAQDISYRQIYFLSDVDDYIKKVENFYVMSAELSSPEIKEKFFSKALSIFGKKYRDVATYSNYLESEVANFKKEIVGLQGTVSELKELLENKTSLTDKLYKRLKSKK